MLVIIGLVCIAVPSALRARKRSAATSTLQTLRILDSACDQWAIEYGKSPGSAGTNLNSYAKKGAVVYGEITAESGSGLTNMSQIPAAPTPAASEYSSP